MPIQGSIEEAGLPDVLQLLAMGRKTGCLSLSDGTQQGHIYLDVGRVSYATVANRLDRLGEVLVKNGRITQQQLDDAVEEQRRNSKRQLGRILVDSGRIDRAELEHFIRFQVEEAVYYLFTWKQGTFAFEADRLPPHQPLLVSIDAEGLLLEGARRVDEWSLIEKKIPSFDLVYRRTRENITATAEGLTDTQKRLLPLIDGECNVTGLVDDTGLSEFDVGKALYGLITAGLIQLVERRTNIRHLDYRELLAYSVREAEFADPQRRRDAARHIVDCVTCAERLRTIHVRQSVQGLGLGLAEAEPLAVGEGVGRVPSVASSAVAAEPLAPALRVERRRRERRAGRDRRKSDRRTGTDRRQPSASRAPHGQVPRDVMRREEDRRGHARDRRGSGFIQPPGSAVAVVAAPRQTEPRQLPPVPAGDLEEPVPAMPEAELPPAVEPSPVPPEPAPAAAAPAPAAAAPAPAAAELETPAAPVAEVVPPGEGAPSAGPEEQAPAPTPGEGRRGQTKELEWLVTPHESFEMIRQTQAQHRAAAVASRGVPAADAVPESRVTAPAGRPPSAAPGFAGAASGIDPAAARERGRAAADARQPGRAVPVAPPAARHTLPVRGLATAAAIAAMAFVGYMAGHVGKGGVGGRGTDNVSLSARAVTPPQAADAGAGTPPAPASQQEPPPQSAAVAPPTSAVSTPTPERRRERRAAEAPAGEVREAPAAEAPTRAAVAPAPAPQPAPTVGVIAGLVRDASGRPIPGARVSVRGTSLAAEADGVGAFTIVNVPQGPATVLASADGFLAASVDVQTTAGETVNAMVTLARPAAALAPDSELAAGGWIRVSQGEATSVLGGTLGIIPGLSVESVAQSAAGSRTRVRVAQLTAAGERIVLTETRAGADVRGGPGPAVVTALRVMPASEAYPWATGTASFGNILISAKTHLEAGALRSYLGRLSEAPSAQ